MNKKYVKYLIVCAIIVILFIVAYLVLDKLLNKEKDYVKEYLKNYEVNEYIPVYVSDEDMARTYYNDYIKKTYYNIEEAYSLLDEEYREKKFGNIDKFKNYIYSNTDYSYKMTKYYKEVNGQYIDFGVYDSNDNLYIFRTNGVMQYKVYLDDYTVEL